MNANNSYKLGVNIEIHSLNIISRFILQCK
jgi:hypothetical protein